MTDVKTGGLCQRCGKEISSDEVGMSKKLINRGTTQFFCLDCLGEAFDVSTDHLRKAMEHYKRQGCTLFAPLASK